MKQAFYVVNLLIRQLDGIDQLLIAKRAANQYMGNTWQLISGGLNEGEPAWRGALREIREETGLIPEKFYRLSTLTQVYRSEIDTLYTAPMFCGVIDPVAIVRINEEHTEYAWVDLHDAHSRLMWPCDVNALHEVQRYIVADHPAKAFMRII